MPPRRSPLYSAVVLAGVSMTSTALTAACSDDDKTPTSSSSSSGGSSSGGSSGGSSGSTGSTGTDGAADANVGDACPPDAELPTPPCYLIK